MYIYIYIHTHTHTHIYIYIYIYIYVHIWFVIIKERIQDGCPPFTNAVCENIIRIVKQLVGDPPDIHHVIAICDFLLLAHPAANAYVFHAELDFYFMPKWSKKV